MTMTGSATPEQWAIRISHILNTALEGEHFPIDVAQVAQELSHALFPNDPISLIKGDALASVEGALVRAPSGKKGWVNPVQHLQRVAWSHQFHGRA